MQMTAVRRAWNSNEQGSPYNNCSALKFEQYLWFFHTIIRRGVKRLPRFVVVDIPNIYIFCKKLFAVGAKTLPPPPFLIYLNFSLTSFVSGTVADASLFPLLVLRYSLLCSQILFPHLRSNYAQVYLIIYFVNKQFLWQKSFLSANHSKSKFFNSVLKRLRSL